MTRESSRPINVTPVAVTSNVDGAPDAVALTLGFERRWWLWLLIGCAWMFASLVILQFDAASVRTVGVIVGCMFVALGAQNFVQAVYGAGYWWLYTAFGVMFVACGIACFVQPEATFAGVADMLGFLFMLVGIWWMVEALFLHADFPLWWMKLVAGIAMNLLAFWTAGQFFIDKAYLLLVFAGIWARPPGRHRRRPGVRAQSPLARLTACHGARPRHTRHTARPSQAIANRFRAMSSNHPPRLRRRRRLMKALRARG